MSGQPGARLPLDYATLAGLDLLMLELAHERDAAMRMPLADLECRRCGELVCTCTPTRREG